MISRLIAACEQFGPYCLIGGLAVNCYVEPVYTLDADLVVVAPNLAALAEHLEQQAFKTEQHPHSLNAQGAGSDLRIQFTIDERYQAFLRNAVDATVLGVRAKIASLEDVNEASCGPLPTRTAALANERKMNWI